MKRLIINADAYGLTEGATRAIEECLDFGVVSSISVNVNFPSARRLSYLVKRYDRLSVGCHLNPVVGPPVLPPEKVPSLLDEYGNFLYKNFVRSILKGRISFEELKAEMEAQIELTRAMAGESLSHLDFHMGVHRLPKLYSLFLYLAKSTGVGRVRTHRYLFGLHTDNPFGYTVKYLAAKPLRIAKYIGNRAIHHSTRFKGIATPDYRIGIDGIYDDASIMTIDNYLNLLRNLPDGTFEFVVHPGYVDDELKKWSTYLEQREIERKILMDERFKARIVECGIELAGYREIPLKKKL